MKSKKIIKFSKNYNSILSIKKSMYNDNKKNLKGILRVNSFYKKQGLRKRCKNCNFKLPKKTFFIFQSWLQFV